MTYKQRKELEIEKRLVAESEAKDKAGRSEQERQALEKSLKRATPRKSETK